MTMVERVARAIYANNGWWRPLQSDDDGMGRYKEGFRAVEWEDLDEDERNTLLSDARAAIEAMREPTEEMCKAPEDFPPDTSEAIKEGWRSVYAIHYRAMIDSALKEKT